MRQEVQWYLVEALANARASLGLPDAADRRQVILARYSGTVAAFRYLGELSVDEEREWHDRFLVAFGITPPPPAPPGVIKLVFVGHPDSAPTEEAPPVAPPAFVRSVAGPDAEIERHGGRPRGMAVEIYDTAVAVRWRVAPEPLIASAFPDEAAQLARDVEGIDAWAAEHLRTKAEQGLRRLRLYRFGLTDDQGTEYHPTGGGHGGGGNEMTGEAKFTPAPPGTASTLTLAWLDVEVPIVLS